MRLLISGGEITNEGRTFKGSIVIDGDTIEDIIETPQIPQVESWENYVFDEVIDATGAVVIPGVIDEHVHFREPGLTRKADIESESRAAAWGGVTSYFDMPNTMPQTTTLETLADKIERAAMESHVNYSFFFGATCNNAHIFASLDRHYTPGIKLFMGASTGNMLVDNRDALNLIFAAAEMPLMVHCEDTQLINANMHRAQFLYGDDPDVRHHTEIRSEEACFRSTALAVELAHKHGTQLHVAHVSTARELDFFGIYDNITAEATLAHLLFTSADYATLGTRVKCNPSVKTMADRDALRHALADGRILTIGTDHAPHEWSDKQGGCVRAASGMPLVQYSLPAMLSLVDDGILTRERMVSLMCHNPATLFDVNRRGFLRRGYKADITIIKKGEPWTVNRSNIQSKCGWSPLEGRSFNWHVVRTICNGTTIYANEDGATLFNDEYRGEPITFR